MVLADDGVATGGMAVMVAVAAEMANAVFWCSPEVTGCAQYQRWREPIVLMLNPYEYQDWHAVSVRAVILDRDLGRFSILQSLDIARGGSGVKWAFQEASRAATRRNTQKGPLDGPVQLN